VIVGDDEIEVRIGRPKLLQRFLRGGGRDHAITLDLEQHAHRIAHPRLVFDQQQL